LAASIERLTGKYAHRMLTIEDPTELVYGNKRSVITQREVGTHTQSFSAALKGVICQQLLKRRGGGRIAAREILMVNAAVSNLIRERTTQQIYSALELGGRVGMISLDRCLAEMVLQGDVDP